MDFRALPPKVNPGQRRCSPGVRPLPSAGQYATAGSDPSVMIPGPHR